MNTIWRTEASLGQIFKAPATVTFGYQAERATFSVWHKSTDPADTAYMIIGTGWEEKLDFELVASQVMPNGFEVYHLAYLLSYVVVIVSRL